jgi:DNA-binding response OmpR family regulator
MMGATPADGRPVVLVVDDSEDVRSLLALLLDRAGCRVLEALDGQAALDLTAGQTVDLVVLDLSMPRLDGAAFCRSYRERGGIAPVILITAAEDDDLHANMRVCGAIGHIPKPFDIDRAVEMIEQLLRRPT